MGRETNRTIFITLTTDTEGHNMVNMCYIVFLAMLCKIYFFGSDLIDWPLFRLANCLLQEATKGSDNTCIMS